MTRIMNATESRELSVLGAEEFKTDVLEGPIFKRVVVGIEDAVLQGLNEYEQFSNDLGDDRTIAIISAELEREGYDCAIAEEGYRIFSIGFKREILRIKW